MRRRGIVALEPYRKQVLSNNNQAMDSKIKIFYDIMICQFSHWKNRKHFNELRTRKGEYTLEGYDRLKCIYVHIPKTAGVAINQALYDNLGWAHSTVREYKRIFGPYTYNKYYSFTFVRNPYARLLSAFRFLRNGGFCENDRVWAERNISRYDSFNQFVAEWLNEQTIWSYHHFKPQYSFVCDISLRPEVDFIGKYERINEDFSTVCNKLGIENRLTVRNSSEMDNSTWSDVYSEPSFKKVSELYKHDFEIFNYESYHVDLNSFKSDSEAIKTKEFLTK